MCDEQVGRAGLLLDVLHQVDDLCLDRHVQCRDALEMCIRDRGYLILFATHTFEPQRQLVPSRPPSPLVFLPISTHSTATPGIPPTSALLKKNSFESSSWVEPMDFTSNLFSRLRSLYTQ